MNRTISLQTTGETISFISPKAASGNQTIEMIVTLPAGSEGPPKHRHVKQSELFEAIEGKLGIECENEKIELNPGESYLVAANSVHRFYAVDGAPLKFKASFSPGLHIDYLLTEMFESANRRRSKDPSPFDACYVLRQIKGEYYLADVPMFVQRIIFPATAVVGKWLGLVKAPGLSAYRQRVNNSD